MATELLANHVENSGSVMFFRFPQTVAKRLDVGIATSNCTEQFFGRQYNLRQGGFGQQMEIPRKGYRIETLMVDNSQQEEDGSLKSEKVSEGNVTVFFFNIPAHIVSFNSNTSSYPTQVLYQANLSSSCRSHILGHFLHCIFTDPNCW